MRVPFTFYGSVVIECTEEEYEDNVSTPLHDKAEKAFDEQIESIGDLDFDGFDFTSSDWMDEEE